MRWVFLGFKASGKSVCGAILAKRLSLPFIDTDQFLEKIFFHSPRKLLEKGEPFFQHCEKHILSLLPTHDVVIATGGRTLLVEEHVTLLRPNSFFIHLDVDLTEIRRRLSTPLPPFLSGPGQLESLFKARHTRYKALSDATMPGDEQFWQTVSLDNLGRVTR